MPIGARKGMETDLTTPLLRLLLEIRNNTLPPKYTYPPRRASVAVIIRINPRDPLLTTPLQPLPRTLEEFFSQSWVHDGSGEPEVLLIKRAARAGDRWTSHVALPGGKRDVGDSGDEEAAVREVREEVGLGMIFPEGVGMGNVGEGGKEVGGQQEGDVGVGKVGTGEATWNCLRVGGLPERLYV